MIMLFGLFLSIKLFMTVVADFNFQRWQQQTPIPHTLWSCDLATPSRVVESISPPPEPGQALGLP